MELMQIQHYNNLSEGLSKKLEERLASFGKTVRYRFDIRRNLHDPITKAEDKVWPSVYTLDPAKFTINDPHESRANISKTKNIALIELVGNDGKPERFGKVRIKEPMRGELVLYIQDRPEDKQVAMFLELHPKNKNGMFPDGTKHQVFFRIDELAAATEERKTRSARKLAMDTAEKMSEADLREFADAMLWDRNQQEEVLRNLAEDLAEHQPDFFNDIVADKKTKILSVLKQSLDNKYIQYNPQDGKLSFASTGQTIVVLGENAGTDGWGKYAEWFLTAGDSADKVYKKLEGMLGLGEKKEPIKEELPVKKEEKTALSGATK